ncbi:Tetratricopeptide repeat-containing protein [Treponema bryantii]|uniref:Tetratricopeptide repeat-containing protein n=1 Tax=Treponema bryantii TaxID=163 RepID=A0A1I3LBA3_9SPIR|nr:tetratricopeptide repeat protein [Treponema bryantii]SFI81695.1 Tetratricopeptide repeat-containing protein [Treponema bryantii]
MIISILIAVIVALLLVSIIVGIKSIKRKEEKKDVSQKIQKKGKSAILKEAEKKLAHDPHNVPSLETIGDIYFSEKNWERVWSVYKTLYDISTAHPEIDIVKCALRMGMAAFSLDKNDDAVSALMLCIKKDPNNFDCNLFLGKALMKANTFDKAVYCFKKAKVLQPENNEVNMLLGTALFKSQKYRDCLPFLKRVLDENPGNKEVLFDMAVAMTECGMGDKALKVFMHLRPDPEFGPQACLEAGKMHERVKDYAAAIKDYEISMRLPSVPDQIMLQIKYRLANTCIAMNDISKALTYLRQIQAAKQGYKDVDALVARYSELNQNKNLQTYLMSGTSDFVALCRKFISTYYKDSFVKVEDVQVASESVEIICEIETSKWEAKQMFRFYRTQNVIGDINVRDFHSKLRDTKCDNGVCVSIGGFSDSAHKYIDGRPVDLIEKDELVKILKRINMFS